MVFFGPQFPGGTRTLRYACQRFVGFLFKMLGHAGTPAVFALRTSTTLPAEGVDMRSRILGIKFLKEQNRSRNIEAVRGPAFKKRAEANIYLLTDTSKKLT